MNRRAIPSVLVLLAAAQGAGAQQPPRALPPVRAVDYVVECQAPRRLPTQAQVGEWTGQRNFSQVYATRERLMGDLARACRRPGIEQVRLVLAPAARPAADPRAPARIAVAAR
jgi:hypothetical protein